MYWHACSSCWVQLDEAIARHPVSHVRIWPKRTFASVPHPHQRTYTPFTWRYSRYVHNFSLPAKCDEMGQNGFLIQSHSSSWAKTIDPLADLLGFVPNSL